VVRPTTTVFPLVPRRRISGVPFGGSHSLRRGRGTDVAALRPYAHGDTVSSIDWRASAKVSTARSDDEFVVRDRFADEAARVVLLYDRSPSLELYPQPFPWLPKREAAAVAAELIARSAAAARASLGYLDFAEASARGDKPYWLPPRSRTQWHDIEARLASAPHDAPADNLERGLSHLERSARSLFAGTFVFVVSDFLRPPPRAAWMGAVARHWEIVPVVVQDPVWEQSFPLVHGVGLPLVEPGTAGLLEVRLSRAEVLARRDAHERRRRDLLAEFAELGIDPVLVDVADPTAIARRFLDWAAARQVVRGRA
jgi:uncharacterized protein (DUF58 family)